MYFLVFLLLIVTCYSDVRVSVDPNGGYTLFVRDQPWLRSARTALYVDNQWYSSDNQSLPLINITSAQGNDPNLGAWNETQLIYDLVRNGVHTNIVGHIRQWTAISAITFHLDTGDQMMTNTLPLDTNQLRTVFPSFYIEQIDMDDQRGFFTFDGQMDF